MRVFSLSGLFLGGLLLAGILGGGCTATQVREHREGLIKRVTFEMSCPEGQLQLTELTKHPGMGWVTSYGVQGCGQRRVYVLSLPGYSWLLNSVEGAVVAASPDSQPPG